MTELVEVRFLELPVAEHQAVAEHIDELLREFTHIDGDREAVPARLLQLRDDLQTRFSAFTSGPRSELDAAAERGDTTLTLTYSIPAEAGEVSQRAIELLDEADEYCRQGDHLLTLAAPDIDVVYRRWFFGEFVRQCAGQPATPWPAFRDAAS